MQNGSCFPRKPWAWIPKISGATCNWVYYMTLITVSKPNLNEQNSIKQLIK